MLSYMCIAIIHVSIRLKLIKAIFIITCIITFNVEFSDLDKSRNL